MQRYRNLSGDSGVTAYAIADTAITVRFRDGGTYVYNYHNPGVEAVEAMKSCARHGAGLATYINTHVRAAYARKLA